MMRKITTLAMVATLASMLALTGCGAGGKAADAGAGSGAVESTAASAQAVDVGAADDRVEVSREDFNDCDGGGHGYTEITYSDGTVETVEY